MTQAIAHTYTMVHDYRRQITRALLATCLTLALIYAINLYRVISHTIALQHITAQISALNTVVDKLDGQYLTISHTITPDALAARGFDQGKVSAFISRTASLGRIASASYGL